MYPGRHFTSVSPHATPGTVFSRNSILAFNAASGAIDTGFVPALTGTDTDVNSIMPGPAPGEVYIAGNFAAVNGVTEHVALLNTSNGQIVSTWKPSAFNGFINKIVLADGMLFVGGTFTTVGGIAHEGLVALNPTTGKLLPYVNLAFKGHHNFGVNCTNCASAPTGVKSFDIDPSGQNLVAVGNFTSVGPQGGLLSPRDQVAYISLGATSASLNPSWATDAYTAACFTGAFDSYIRDVQFSTDGSYFVIVGTGGSGTNSDGTNSSCDTAARYETNGTGADVRPTWIDYTGQDSWWSVAITGTAVYVGGHNRWANNSHGYDFAGPGAVPRSGIAALDPQNGCRCLEPRPRSPWGRRSALLATPTGLWVGSDTDYIGTMAILHEKIAFFPLAGGEVLQSNATPTLPVGSTPRGRSPRRAPATCSTGSMRAARPSRRSTTVPTGRATPATLRRTATRAATRPAMRRSPRWTAPFRPRHRWGSSAPSAGIQATTWATTATCTGRSRCLLVTWSTSGSTSRTATAAPARSGSGSSTSTSMASPSCTTSTSSRPRVTRPGR